MLKEQLTGNTMFIDTIESWQEAIRMGAEPLVNNGIVEKLMLRRSFKTCWKMAIILFCRRLRCPMLVQNMEAKVSD